MTRAEQIAFAKKYGFDVVGPNKRIGHGFVCSCCWGSDYHGLTCPEHGATGMKVKDAEKRKAKK